MKSGGFKVPESEVDVEIGARSKGVLYEVENAVQVFGRVFVREVVCKTVKRKIHLSQNRVQKEFRTHVVQEHSVRDEEYRRSVARTDFEKLRKLSMNQGVAHQVIGDLRGEGRHLFCDGFKKLKRHGFFCPNHFRTKRTL